MSKDELIIHDFAENIPFSDVEDKFIRLYPDYDEDVVKVFSYFHQSFNSLFGFLNQKSHSNGHYNAAQSYELLQLIEKLEDLQQALKSVGVKLSLAESYASAIQVCRKFLKSSWGSPIPEDFEPIQLIKYDPIFELADKAVRVPGGHQNYALTEVGRGAYSIVSRYKDEHYNKEFALKQAKNDLDVRELTRIKREFEILNKLSFPYVVEVYRYDQEKDNYTMEYCDSTLEKYITTRNEKLGFENRKKLALQFLYGLNYIHLKKILHRDVSLGNILIKTYDYGSALVKLSDFGLMKEDGSDFTKTETKIKGTIIDPCLDSFKNYNKKHEIYAIGFVLWFIFTGKTSLHHQDSKLYGIIEKCLDRDMDKRYQDVTSIIRDVDAMTNLS